MHGPALVGWLLAAVCGGAGALCLLRLRGCRAGGERGTAGVEGLMGVGMAVMALPPAVLPAAPPQAFAVVFTGAALWSLALLRAGAAHQGHHLLESLAMVYMALAMAGAGAATATAEGAAPAAAHGAGHSGTAGHPAVTALLLGYFAGYALRTGHRLLTPAAPRRPSRSGAAMDPELAAACRLALALGMVTMLLTL